MRRKNRTKSLKPGNMLFTRTLGVGAECRTASVWDEVHLKYAHRLKSNDFQHYHLCGLAYSGWHKFPFGSARVVGGRRVARARRVPAVGERGIRTARRARRARSQTKLESSSARCQVYRPRRRTGCFRLARERLSGSLAGECFRRNRSGSGTLWVSETVHAESLSQLFYTE